MGALQDITNILKGGSLLSEIADNTRPSQAPEREVKVVQQVSITLQLPEDEDAFAVAQEITKLGKVVNLNIYKQRDYGYGDLPF